MNLLKLIVLTCLSAWAAVDAFASKPDIGRRHFGPEAHLGPTEVAMEWGYRLYWVKSDSSQYEYGIMVNVLDTAARPIVPIYPPFSLLPFLVPIYFDRATAQVSIIAMNGNFYRTFQKTGSLNQDFVFQSDDGRWKISNNIGSGRVDIRDDNLDLQLNSAPERPAAYYSDWSESLEPGWLNNYELGQAVYVSQTREKSFGNLRIGEVHSRVSGISWLDRQWMTSDILGQLGKDFSWKWFSVQLLDEKKFDQDLMLYQLFEPNSGRVIKTYGSWVNSNGEAHPIDPSKINFETLNWSKGVDSRFATRWRISINHFEPAVGDLTIDLEYAHKSPWIEAKSPGLRAKFLEGVCLTKVSAKGSTGQTIEVPANAWAEQVSTKWFNLDFSGL